MVFLIIQKKERSYHRKGFRGEYAFPLIWKPGTLPEYEVLENWVALPWFNDGLLEKVPEKEGGVYGNALPWFNACPVEKVPETKAWEYWNELDAGYLMTKPGWHVEAETGVTMNTNTMRTANAIATRPALRNFPVLFFITMPPWLYFILSMRNIKYPCIGKERVSRHSPVQIFFISPYFPASQ